MRYSAIAMTKQLKRSWVANDYLISAKRKKSKRTKYAMTDKKNNKTLSLRHENNPA